MKEYRVILVQQPAIRQEIKEIVSKMSYIKVIGEADNGKELLENLLKLIPDLVILDIEFPELNGIKAAIKIKDDFPQIKILFLTRYGERAFVYQAISTRAEGYLLESEFRSELENAVATIMRGKNYLSPLLLSELLFKRGREDLDKRLEEKSISPREREIIKLIAEGNTSRQIGEKLFISERTVHRHRANILKKLGLKRTVEIIKYAINKGED